MKGIIVIQSGWVFCRLVESIWGWVSGIREETCTEYWTTPNPVTDFVLWVRGLLLGTKHCQEG